MKKTGKMKSEKESLPKKGFSALLTHNNYEDKIDHDATMLSLSYVSEINMIMEKRKPRMQKKDLAKLVETSPSYITQVFRGDKKINFKTLAKIQDKLGVKFVVTAYEKCDEHNNIISRQERGTQNPFIHYRGFADAAAHSKWNLDQLGKYTKVDEFSTTERMDSVHRVFIKKGALNSDLI